jgi:predicted metal-dependent HD superfamily phosphohydrolase
MSYNDLIDGVKLELIHFFNKHRNLGFVYHNREHTEQVVGHVKDISDHYQLPEKDRFIVTSAAWFHDMGYFTGNAEDHEQRGADAAAEFLNKKGVSEEEITAVQRCILATRLPQAPTNLLEQIVCDSDLFHFGTEEFAERNKLMRKEAEWRKGIKISKKDWRKGTIKLLETHRYHTDFCQRLLNGKKAANLSRLKVKESDDDEPALTDAHGAESRTSPANHVVTEIKKQKFDRPDKGIETMFRITSNNNQRLSDMADNKANIMITTTSIILSVLLSVLVRKLEENPYLTIPTILLITICVITMVFSILATRPSLPHGTFTQDNINQKNVNLLFFGNFYRMTFQDYYAGMQEMMNDREFLYGSLTRDVYAQGVVLGRKYRLLRVAYNVFMFGVIVSVIAFVISSFLSGGTREW